MRRDPGGDGTDSGFSWVELLLAMALAASMTAMTVPLTARSVEALRARDAAGFVATRIRLARQQAVTSAGNVALVFDDTGAGWTFRLCRDRNGNGVRRADIDAGRDDCPGGPWRLGDLFPGLAIARDAAIPGVDSEPGSPDALALGSSNMVSCSPLGGCSSGSIFLRTASHDHFVVRVSGVAGRARVLRFDRGSGQWRPV